MQVELDSNMTEDDRRHSNFQKDGQFECFSMRVRFQKTSCLLVAFDQQEYWNDLRADTGTLFFPDKIQTKHSRKEESLFFVVVKTIPPIQQNSLINGYDENKGYDESYENKCATNYSIITNNNWNDTHNKLLTMHNKYTNDDVDFDDCVVHIMR